MIRCSAPIEPRPGVYAIVNLITGRAYVGSSVNVKKRVLRHSRELKNGNHHSWKLQRAWNSNESDVFEVCALAYVDTAMLLSEEQRCIDALGAASFGYNVMPFADRHELSDETRLRMSASLKGKNSGKRPSPEKIAAIREKLTGRKLSEKTIAKRVETLANRSEEVRAAVGKKIGDKLRGVPKSDAHRAAMSIARTKVWAEKRAAKLAQEKQ